MEFPSVCPARWLPDQHFAMCMTPHDFMSSFQDMQSSYYRPWKWYNQTIPKGFGSTVENEKGNYKITLDVQYFRPNEINVKVTNYEIIVEGKHEERPDIHGFVTRQFKRRYPLPNHCPSENVTSTLSSDGVLTIIAEKKLSINQTEKIVPINISGTFARKTQIETKTTSEITQKALKDERKKEKEEAREDHSCLLRPELLKEFISETNGTCMKTETNQSIDTMKTSDKMDQLNITSNSNKIEESVGKSILGLTTLTEQLGQNSSAFKTEIDGIKIDSEMSGIKSLGVSGMQITADMSGIESITEMSDKKSTSEKSGTKQISEVSKIQNVSEISGGQNEHETSTMKSASEVSVMKNASGMSGIKSALETTGMTSASEICGVRGMGKTLVGESASSYMSSSSMLSNISVSGNTRECIGDIRKELREAAENV